MTTPEPTTPATPTTPTTRQLRQKAVEQAVLAVQHNPSPEAREALYQAREELRKAMQR